MSRKSLSNENIFKINLNFPPEVPIYLYFRSWSVLKLVLNQNLRETNCFTAFPVIFHSQGIFFHTEKFFRRIFFLFLHEQTLQFSYEHHQTKNPISCNVIARGERKEQAGERKGWERASGWKTKGKIKGTFHPKLPNKILSRLISDFHQDFSCVALFSRGRRYSARNNIKVHYKEHKFICPSVFSLWASNNTEGPGFSLYNISLPLMLYLT